MTEPVLVLLPDDAGSFARLHALCFERPWQPSEFRSLLSQSNCLALGIRDDTDLVAAILIQHAAGDAEILTICIAPKHRKRGLAKHLLMASEQSLGERGMGCIHLDVAEDNSAARIFYESSGFTIAGRRKNYYRQDRAVPCDAILMSKSLALRGSGFH